VIVVFGSLNVDLVARVARLPSPGETIAGVSFAALPGGKGANQALAAARAGAQVAMVGAVGNDAFADIALSQLTAGGVDVSAVRRVDAPTGVALVHVDDSGQNAITVVAGANALARARSVPIELVDRDVTLLAQLEVPLAEVSAALGEARHRGARVALNAAPAAELPGELLESLSLLIVNEIEAAMIARDLRVPAAPERFATHVDREYGCACAITLGSEGALLAADRRLLRAAAPRVAAVDTTGAGDAFTGALAAALDRAAPWQRALAEAVAAGSLACTVAGAQLALPVRAAIEGLAASIEAKVVVA
jgi:ribokinase